jgi:hypothetical protein
MSGERKSSAVIGSWMRVAGTNAPNVMLALVLLSGVVHATPIVANPSTVKTATGLVAIEVGLEPNLNGGVSMKPTPTPCSLSGGCSSPVEVPEPQALVLVGTGALSMAGVIRRRLTR